MTPQVSIRDASYTYDGERVALDRVSFEVERGSYVVVLGRNGSGKSTLARLIGGLVAADSGEVEVCGIAGVDGGLVQIRRHVGLVFQNPDDQMVTSVVADDVAFGPENLGIPQSEIASRVDAALAAVGMSAYAQADPADLSGGQKQRVAIAGALAMEPEILVFDEPCAMLDPQGRDDVRSTMRSLAGRGITVVHVTHFMEDALEADAVHVMDRGRIVLSGTPDEVFSRGDELRALGLEQPFALRLARALRARGVAVVDTPRIENLEVQLCRLSSTM